MGEMSGPTPLTFRTVTIQPPLPLLPHALTTLSRKTRRSASSGWSSSSLCWMSRSPAPIGTAAKTRWSSPLLHPGLRLLFVGTTRASTCTWMHPMAWQRQAQHWLSPLQVSSIPISSKNIPIFLGTLVSRYWRIRVDQIYCGELFSPPHGCTQFFMSESGRVRSYNFGVNDNYHHLADQDYAVCFRRARGSCRISYSASEEGESFWVSRNPTATAYASAGESTCIADFLIIPRGTNGGAGTQCTVSMCVTAAIIFIILFSVTISSSNHSEPG